MKTVGRRQKAVGRQSAGVRGRWLGSGEKPDFKREVPGGYKARWPAISLIVAVVITEAVGVVAQVPPQDGAKQGLVVTVRVYNYAEASHVTISRAESEAGRIIGATGVAVLWLDCLAPRDPSPSQHAGRDCGGPVSGATLVLRILPRSSPANATFRDTMFGYADGSALASVFLGRIEDFARSVDGDGAETPAILGHAVAHELGHLLLGTMSHSPTGVMCGQWDGSYLRRALMGRQAFSPEQAEHIRTEVRIRIQTSEVAHKGGRAHLD